MAEESGESTTAQATGEDARLFRWGLGAVLIVAAILRGAYLWHTLADPLLRDLLILDSRHYDAMASAIAGGDLAAGREVFLLSPLYPYFLASIRVIFGEGTAPVYAAQQLLGLGSITLTALLARRCFGAGAALFAAGLTALYGAMALLELKVMASTVTVFLSLSSLYLLLRARSGGRRAEALAAGLVLGLACLARPNTLLFAPLAALWLLWDGALRRPLLRRFDFARLPAGLLLTVGVALAIAPATLRNVRVSGEWVLISAQGGITFYQANNERAQGVYTRLPGIHGTPADQHRQARARAERDVGRSLTASEVSRYWMREGLAYLFGNPLEAAILVAKKLHHWIASDELSTEYVLPVERRLVPSLWLMSLPFGVILALALLGLRATGAGRAEHWLLHGFVAANLASVLLFYFSSRYRLPAVPVLACFAGQGCVALGGRLRSPRRELLGWLAPSVVLAAYSLHSWSDYLCDQGAQQLYNYAQVYSRQGRHEAAIAKYEAALDLQGARWPIRLRLGAEYEQIGDYESALREYERVLESRPRNRLALLRATGARAKLRERAPSNAPSPQQRGEQSER